MYPPADDTGKVIHRLTREKSPESKSRRWLPRKIVTLLAGIIDRYDGRICAFSGSNSPSHYESIKLVLGDINEFFYLNNP